jgi:hypothetical protein
MSEIFSNVQVHCVLNARLVFMLNILRLLEGLNS